MRLLHNTFETFKNDIVAFIVGKFLRDMFVDEKFTQDTFETFNCEILDTTL